MKRTCKRSLLYASSAKLFWIRVIFVGSRCKRLVGWKKQLRSKHSPKTQIMTSKKHESTGIQERSHLLVKYDCG